MNANQRRCCTKNSSRGTSPGHKTAWMTIGFLVALRNKLHQATEQVRGEFLKLSICRLLHCENFEKSPATMCSLTISDSGKMTLSPQVHRSLIFSTKDPFGNPVSLSVATWAHVTLHNAMIGLEQPVKLTVEAPSRVYESKSHVNRLICHAENLLAPRYRLFQEYMPHIKRFVYSVTADCEC